MTAFGRDGRFRALICDFGGVLTSPLFESFAAYQRATGIGAEQLGEAMARVTEKWGGRHPLFELEKGRITEVEFLRQLEVELGGGVRLDAFRDTYFEHLRPNEAMIGFVRALKVRGLRTAMLTNNVREWEPLWRAKFPDLEDVFDVVVDSAFVGMRKPEPEIYLLTVERLGGGLTPSECLFVDDLEVNCEAARALGMGAVRFEHAEQTMAAVEAALA